MPAKKKPAKAETREKHVMVRLTDREYEAFTALAADVGSISAWCRLACIEKARKLGIKV